MAPRITSDQVWGRLLEIADAIGDVKVQIATCASNIKAQADILTILTGHQREANGNASAILQRLVALELAGARDCGEVSGGRRQWRIIAAVIVVAAAVAGTVGTFIGLVIH
jgi:hypothetical protein